MASITVEIVSKTTSEAGTTFVLAASEEEIKRAGFVPYFIDEYFQGAFHPVNVEKLAAVTPYGYVAFAPEVESLDVFILPFVPALTEVVVNEEWIGENALFAYKLEKTQDKPNGTYVRYSIFPNMNVGDTLVFSDTQPADPA